MGRNMKTAHNEEPQGHTKNRQHQDSVVQSIVSLTYPIVVKMLTVLVSTISSS